MPAPPWSGHPARDDSLPMTGKLLPNTSPGPVDLLVLVHAEYSPADDAADGNAQRSLEDGSLGMGDGEGYFAQGFVGGILARHTHGIGSAYRIVAEGQLEGAVGFVSLVEEFGLGLTALQGGEHGTNIGESPLHGDFVVPVELFVAVLSGGIDEDGRFGRVETEAQYSAVTAGVWLVEGVISGALGGWAGG